MKVLVYGSGVIGSYLAHVLCSAGNDVTMLARGAWKTQLEAHGLRIRHHLQRTETLEALFGKTGYRLCWQRDMEAYLICHLAAILPIGFLAYICGGDMRSSTGRQRRLIRRASREAYAMLRRQGIPVLPEGDDRYYEPGPRGAVMQFLYFVMAKNKTIGDLVACEHCRNAFEEMEMLDGAFDKVMARAPEEPMASWRALKAQMPAWDEIRRTYGRQPA